MAPRCNVRYGVSGPHGWLSGSRGAEYLLGPQLEGVKRAKSLALIVKINMVIVPGIIDGHAPSDGAVLEPAMEADMTWTKWEEQGPKNWALILRKVFPCYFYHFGKKTGIRFLQLWKCL